MAVYRIWLRQYLQIRWRRWLTDVYIRTWLADRTYYRMELTGHGTDNPEQRIEQDMQTRSPRRRCIIGLDLLTEVMTLVTFTVILWNLSGSLTLADPRRRRNSRLHDVGGACVYAIARLLG